MVPILRLGLLVNFTRPHAYESLAYLSTIARKVGIKLFAPDEIALQSDDIIPCDPNNFLKNDVQGVISLGGDGTFLASSHVLANVNLPLIGLNIGNLGYLTAANEEKFDAVLTALATGNYAIDTRAMVSTSLQKDDGSTQTFPAALNDVVISRAEGGRTIKLSLELDGYPVAKWVCDGVILATPTGSTAYSLSVGGPVVLPMAKVLIVNVIAPHTLSARPLIIPEHMQITISIDSEPVMANIDIDGVSRALLRKHDRLNIQLSPKIIKIIKPKTINPYTSLSQKLHWSEAFGR